MCRARFARLIIHPPGGGLKVTEGAHISVILGPGGPIFTIRLGGDLRGGRSFMIPVPTSSGIGE